MPINLVNEIDTFPCKVGFYLPALPNIADCPIAVGATSQLWIYRKTFLPIFVDSTINLLGFLRVLARAAGQLLEPPSGRLGSLFSQNMGAPHCRCDQQRADRLM